MEVAPKEIILNKKAILEKEIASEEKITSLSQISPVEDYEDRKEEQGQEKQSSNGIFLSSNKLEQGDTLLIKIEEKTENIKGKFGQEELDFVKVDDGWISIFGIDVKKNLGKYSLSINMGEEKFEREITVIKRNFPITEFYVR